MTTTTCLWTPEFFGIALAWDGIPWFLRVLLGATAAFLVPTLVLGMLSSAVTCASLADPSHDGRVVGRLQALGSLGAVAGAVLAGFVLIPGIGIEGLLVAIAAVLAVAAGRVRGRGAGLWCAGLCAIALVLWLPFEPLRAVGRAVGLRPSPGTTLLHDSRYYRVRVFDHDLQSVRLEREPLPRPDEAGESRGRTHYDPSRRELRWRGTLSAAEMARIRSSLQSDRDRASFDSLESRVAHRIRGLALDRLIHGLVDLDDPLWLSDSHERIYAGMVLRRATARSADSLPVHVLCIGGGSYSIQRHLLGALGSRVRCVTAEIDPAVTEAGRRALGLTDDARHRIVHEDARTFVEREDEDQPPFDWVLGDAVDDFSVPPHLTTAEFVRSLRRRMRHDGVYLQGVIDRFDVGRFLGAVLRTLEASFGSVQVVSLGPRDDRRRGTFVLAATDGSLDLSRLESPDERVLDLVTYSGADLDELRSRAGPRILTDDHAPVESLLAPVAARR
jgi:spermidine synthase